MPNPRTINSKSPSHHQERSDWGVQTRLCKGKVSRPELLEHLQTGRLEGSPHSAGRGIAGTG